MIILSATPRSFDSLLRTATVCALFVPAAYAAQEAARSYDIPAGEAAVMFRAFSNISGREILFSADAVRGVRVNAVAGKFTAGEALDRMLRGTQLRSVQDKKTGAFVVTAAPPAAEPPRAAPSPPSAQNSPNSPELPRMKKPLSTPARWLAAILTIGSVSTAAGADPAPAAGDDVVVLSPFAVDASADRGYVAGNAISATRINTGVNDLPFSITAYTPQFINDIGATNLMDVATETAGVKSGVSSNTQGNVFSVRGFLQTPQRNGFASSPLTANYVDATVIDRVEVIKGPASLLYGAIAPGGTVNYITKSAELQPFGELHLAMGSYNFESFSYDVNQPLVSKTVLFRLVTTYENGEQYEQNAKSRTIVVYPTIKWLITPKVSLTFDYQWFDDKESPAALFLPNTDLANPSTIVNALNNPGHPSAGAALANKTGPDVALGVSDVSDPGFMGPYPGLPKNFNIADIHNQRHNDLQTIEGTLEFNLNEHWSGRSHYSVDIDRLALHETGHGTLYVPPPDSLVYSGGVWSVAPGWSALSSSQQIAQSLAFAKQAVNNLSLLESTQNGVPSPALLDRSPRVEESWLYASTFQTEAVGTYNFPTFKLQALFGVFYDSAHFNSRTTQNAGNVASPNFRDWDVSPGSPTYYVNSNEGTVAQQNLTVVSANTLSFNSDSAAYSLLNASFFQNRLYLVAGARYNVSESQTTDYVAKTVSPGLHVHYTTPQVGVGFKITPDVMLYGSYSESYTLPSQPFLSALGTVNGEPGAVPTGPSAPTIGKGEEFGVKTDFMNHTLNMTLSLYQIEETGVIQQLNENISGFQFIIWNQGAEERGRGVEFTTNWSPLNNWQIVFNASEEDVRNTAEPVGLAYYLGQNVGYTAKTLSNLWTRYDFAADALKGLWIGAGVDYTGRSAGDPRNIGYFLPAYTLYSSALGFSWKWNKTKMSATLNFKNMGNTLYKPSPNSPGEPRRLLLSTTVHF